MTPITIKVEVTGSYEVKNGMIRVTGPNGRIRATQLGSTPADVLAEMLLREMVQGV